MKKFPISQNLCILLALLLGALTPILHLDVLMIVANVTSDITIKTLQLISLPLIFLSVVATLSGMESMTKLRILGSRIFRYTLLTTIIAASISCILYALIGPAVTNANPIQGVETTPNLLSTLLSLYPSNIVGVFAENNVFGVMLVAVSMGAAILVLPNGQQETLHSFFQSLFTAFLKIASFIIKFLPISIWAFVAIFCNKIMTDGIASYKPIAAYLIIVISANLIQGFIVLPIMLKVKGISPIKVFKAVAGALNVAFFSKSSNATLPITMSSMENKLGVPSKITSFSLPLCSTINMNGCAAFIFTTVVFISSQAGIAFSPLQMVAWILVATLAAIGNAGVPMGCFFLSSALLAGAGVPLELMGLILPLYALIDMLETALNVWSDCCVTAVVAKEVEEQEKVSIQ